MNTELLLRVCDKIVAEPELFLMDHFLVRTACGTMGCIAGHALLLTSGEPPIGSTCNTARLELRLSVNQANNLFFIDGWPWNFADAYESAETPLCAANITALRIKHFIATYGQE